MSGYFCRILCSSCQCWQAPLCRVRPKPREAEDGRTKGCPPHVYRRGPPRPLPWVAQSICHLSWCLLPLPQCFPQPETPSYDANSFSRMSILKIFRTIHFSTKRYYSRHDRRHGSHTSWMTNGPADGVPKPCRCVVAQGEYVLGCEADIHRGGQEW